MSQALPLREQLKALEHLQEIDLKIDNLRKNKAALPVAMKALEDSFNRARNAVEAKKNAILEQEKLQRQTQAALELNRDRVSRSNAKLQGVQNTAEYQAATKEVEQLRKMALTLEEQSKKAVDEMANGAKDVERLEGEHQKIKGERDEKAAAVQGQVDHLEVEIQKILGDRKQYSVKVEPRTLAIYDRVRGAKNGIGLVPATGGRCSGCNMMLPPQQYNQVQRCNEVQACPSCHRILFIPQASTDAAV